MTGIESKKNKDNLSRIIPNIIIFLFVCIGIYFIFGMIVSPNFDFSQYECEEYLGEWEYINVDGTKTTFVLPHSFDVKKGDTVTFSTVLPDDIMDDRYLCIRTGRSFVAYVDGVEIYNFDATKCMTGPIVKAYYLCVPLKKDYAGRKLTIYKYDTSADNSNVGSMYIGDMYGIYRMAFGKASMPFNFAVVLALLAILTLIIFSIISRVIERKLPIVYLALGILCAAFWVICDSYMFQIVFDRVFFDGTMAYMITILLACPFFVYLNLLQEGRYAKIYNVFSILNIINFVVLCILHFTNTATFGSVLYHIDAVVFADILLIFGIIIYDYVKNKESVKNKKYLHIGMGGLLLFSVVEIIVIILNFNNNQLPSGIYLLIGLFILLGFAITDQIHSLREYQRFTNEAIAATKAKSDFLANMSHEIRTPINAIIGMNEMILRESKDDNITEYAHDVYTASNRLLDIVNDILDFSRVEAGKVEIIEREYNIGETISLASNMIEIKTKEKKLDFRVEASEKLPKVLYGDEKRISEVMINILNNAVKYTVRGVILFSIYGEYDEQGFNLVFSVKDTGIGIKPEDQAKLFGDFERFDSEKNRNIEGTGLGLAITARLVDMMGGSIFVDSLYGSGSKFTIRLPQRVIDDTPIGNYLDYRRTNNKEDKDIQRDYIAPEAKVLIVDDLAINRKVITRLLSKTQIMTVEADSGQKMLELIEKEHFDLILLDHMMPGMDGVDTLKAVSTLESNQCANTPIIALTANAIVGAKEQYLRAGFTDYLSKPVKPFDLESMVLKYLPEEQIIYK